MSLEEFESQYRQELDKSLNELQTVVLLMANLEARIANIGHNLQDFSQAVEKFLTEEKGESSPPPL